MNPFEWKAFESADVHFALWWIFTLTASWFLAKEPSFMLSRLHSLFNFRIFLQAMRHKSNDAGVLTTGWSLIGIGALGLLLMDTSPVHDLFHTSSKRVENFTYHDFPLDNWHLGGLCGMVLVDKVVGLGC